jgi:hypothetical protein
MSYAAGRLLSQRKGRSLYGFYVVPGNERSKSGDRRGRIEGVIEDQRAACFELHLGELESTAEPSQVSRVGFGQCELVKVPRDEIVRTLGH